MIKLYFLIPLVIVGITAAAHVIINNMTFTLITACITIVGGFLAVYMAKKSFKKTPGMEDY